MMIQLLAEKQKQLESEIKLMINERLYKDNKISKEMFQKAKLQLIKSAG